METDHSQGQDRIGAKTEERNHCGPVTWGLRNKWIYPSVSRSGSSFPQREGDSSVISEL